MVSDIELGGRIPAESKEMVLADFLILSQS